MTDAERDRLQGRYGALAKNLWIAWVATQRGNRLATVEQSEKNMPIDAIGDTWLLVAEFVFHEFERRIVRLVDPDCPTGHGQIHRNVAENG